LYGRYLSVFCTLGEFHNVSLQLFERVARVGVKLMFW
jgi:hypothetical protein